MQWIVIACQSLFSGFNVKVEQAIKQNDIKKLSFMCSYLKLFNITLCSIAFLSTYALQNVLSKFVNSFPEFVSHGFEIDRRTFTGTWTCTIVKGNGEKRKMFHI